MGGICGYCEDVTKPLSMSDNGNLFILVDHSVADKCHDKCHELKQIMIICK